MAILFSAKPSPLDVHPPKSGWSLPALQKGLSSSKEIRCLSRGLRSPRSLSWKASPLCELPRAMRTWNKHLTNLHQNEDKPSFSFLWAAFFHTGNATMVNCLPSTSWFCCSPGKNAGSAKIAANQRQGIPTCSPWKNIGYFNGQHAPTVSPLYSPFPLEKGHRLTICFL